MQCKYNRNVPLDSPPKYRKAFDCDTGLLKGADRRELLCVGFDEPVVLIQLVDL